MFNAIHVTHEAVWKVGGIGTVLEGLINSRPYRDNVGRTVLVCPLFYPENPERLGPGGVIEYSSLDGIYEGPYVHTFRRIENEWGTPLVYGRRPLEDEPSGRRTICEVLLVDVRSIHRHRLNEVKGTLFQRYRLPSDRYEHIWEFEQYIELAGPSVAALEAMHIGAEGAPAAVFAHEFMGVPAALLLQAWCPSRYRTLFYAHEVAPIRRIVEDRPGHDVMFYNTLHTAHDNGLYLEEVFGSQADYHKTAVVDAAHHCDGLLAVGHLVQQELLFLHPDFESCDITLCYNGVPVRETTYDERTAARERLRRYVQGLLGWRPDLIFTHVTRLAQSKAMWRDLDVLLAVDRRLRDRGQTAVMLVLSTELPRRPISDILRMEERWDWPLAHREGHPDLTGGEANYYQLVQSFNARARNVKLIYVNQFGFDAARAGVRVPPDVEFLDLRRASDVEFGLSLYEPFGISPLEPLTYGGICLVSTSCGCSGFVTQASRTKRAPNVILANYIDGVRRPQTVKESVLIGAAERREVELKLAEQLADQILKRLPQDREDDEKLIKSGYELARHMSWDVVAERFVFPAIRRASARRRPVTVVA